jgi:hypothetical protein
MPGGRVLKRWRLVRLAGKHRAYRDRPTNSVPSEASVVARAHVNYLISESTIPNTGIAADNSNRLAIFALFVASRLRGPYRT